MAYYEAKTVDDNGVLVTYGASKWNKEAFKASVQFVQEYCDTETVHYFIDGAPVSLGQMLKDLDGVAP